VGPRVSNPYEADCIFIRFDIVIFGDAHVPPSCIRSGRHLCSDVIDASPVGAASNSATSLVESVPSDATP
jgi:hypothetical protein